MPGHRRLFHVLDKQREDRVKAYEKEHGEKPPQKIVSIGRGKMEMRYVDPKTGFQI